VIRLFIVLPSLLEKAYYDEFMLKIHIDHSSVAITSKSSSPSASKAKEMTESSFLRLLSSKMVNVPSLFKENKGLSSPALPELSST